MTVRADTVFQWSFPLMDGSASDNKSHKYLNYVKHSFFASVAVWYDCGCLLLIFTIFIIYCYLCIQYSLFSLYYFRLFVFISHTDHYLPQYITFFRSCYIVSVSRSSHWLLFSLLCFSSRFNTLFVPWNCPLRTNKVFELNWREQMLHLYYANLSFPFSLKKP